MTHSGIERLRWLNQSPYKIFAWRLFESEAKVDLPPKGGQVYPKSGAFSPDSYHDDREVTPTHESKPWWKPSGDAWEFRLTWELPLSDFLEVFGQHVGAPVSVFFELLVQRIQVNDQGQPYYNIDSPVWTFDVGQLLGNVVQKTVYQGLQGTNWVARTILMGYIKTVSPVNLLVSLGWTCWHQLTDDKMTRAEFRCKLVYGWHLDTITRVKQPTDLHEQVQPSDPDLDVSQWELVGFAGASVP